MSLTIISTSRRQFFVAGLAGLAPAVAPGSASSPKVAVDDADVTLAPLRGEAEWLPPRLALSSYSLWHFEGESMPMEEVFEVAARLDLAGVDVLHRQLQLDDVATLRGLRKRAFALGLDLVCLSTHQGFLSAEKEVRVRNVEHTEHCLTVAAELGIPLIRVNTGNWGTLDFEALMAARGIEEPPPGLTVEAGFDWVIEAYGQLCQRAEQLGVVMALENHWGLSRRVEGLLRIVDEVNSPWLVPMLDTGNLLEEDRYEQMELLAPKAALVQAKTYYGGGIYYDLEIDYARVREILKAAKFSGYLCLEAEGKAEPLEAVRRSVAMLREVVGVR